MSTRPNIPLFFPGDFYVNGLNLRYTGAKTIAVSPGAARDTSNTNDIVLEEEIVLNGATTGVNGVDLDPFPGSGTNFYAVFIIADSTKYKTTAGLFVETTADGYDPVPVLPFGYDMYRRIGYVLVTSGNIEIFYQYGTDQRRTMYYDEPLEVLNAGNATSYNTVNLNDVVPDFETEVYVDIDYTANSATNVASFTIGQGLGIEMVRYGTGVAARQRGSFWMPTKLSENDSSFQYKVTNGSDSLTLKIIGFVDPLYPRIDPEA